MWRWLSNNHQTLTAVGAMLVGIAALYVAWDQGRVMRAQQHGAVFPVLQVDGFVGSNGETGRLGLRISNTGVGPALIESVTVLHDGVEQESFDDFIARLPAGHDVSWAGLAGRALAAGDAVEPVRFDWVSETVDAQAIRTAANAWEGWELKVCYCSVFGRCWNTSQLGGARAERVAACPRDDTDMFESLGTDRVLGTPETAASRPEDTQ